VSTAEPERQLPHGAAVPLRVATRAWFLVPLQNFGGLARPRHTPVGRPCTGEPKPSGPPWPSRAHVR